MIIKGNKHTDTRGTLRYNNDFDASKIKRIYTIENASLDFIRGWQGHKIEQRWFSVMSGKFTISVIEIDNWETPSEFLLITNYTLSAESLDFLHIPAGRITAIQAIEPNSKLLVLADFNLGELQDEFRFPSDYFKFKT
jgi:dTDP-4-dehydrorhamnose 3,5-epimerase-like enzyme